MRALVVYESMFGNTRAVAEAIGAGLAGQAVTDVCPVDEARSRLSHELDLLVIGGPTHAWGMSRRSTRTKAADQARAGGKPVPQTDSGIREWLAAVPLAPGLPVAVFDTRLHGPLSGSASRSALRALRRLGCDTRPGSAPFYVQGSEGPLRAGELERARRWGQSLSQNGSRART